MAPTRLLQATVIVAGLAAAAGAPARAQLLEGGARAVALARAGVAAGGDAWAEANPAAWATLEGARVEAFASQSFGLPDLRLGAVAAALPTRAGTVAVGARAFGPAEYRELRVTAGAARALPVAPGRRIAVGARADVLTAAIGGFGSASTLDLTLGTQLDVFPTLRAGLAARGLAGILRADSADLRTTLSSSPALVAGLAYRTSPTSLMLVACEKDLDFPAVVRAGFEWSPLGAVTLRLGAVTAAAGVPARLSAGGAFRAGRTTAEIAVEWHEVLGPSPAFGLGLVF